MKKILVSFFLLSSLGISSFALSCGKTDHFSDPNFCANFEAIAKCNCSAQMHNNPKCQDMNFIITSMKSVTIDVACRMQRDTTTEDCKDNWNCYIKGGSDSRTRLCRTSGAPC